jgi:hypothetical protein
LSRHSRSELDIARDELLSHIHRCGVLKALPEQQAEWLEDTMQYMAERYTSLTEEQIKELHQIGHRFCQPVISRVSPVESEDSEQDEMAGAA